MGRRYKQKRCRREYGSLGSRFEGWPGGRGDSRQGAKTPRQRGTPTFPPPAALILKNRLIFLKNDLVCLKNSPLFSKGAVTAPMYPHRSALVPTRVWPCTHMGLPVCPDGYGHAPAWVCPRTQMGLPVYPHGYGRVPRWVWPCTRMGLPAYPDGFARVPRWVWPCTRMGPPVHPDGYPPESARLTGKSSRVPLQEGRFFLHRG